MKDTVMHQLPLAGINLPDPPFPQTTLDVL